MKVKVKVTKAKACLCVLFASALLSIERQSCLNFISSVSFYVSSILDFHDCV